MYYVNRTLSKLHPERDHRKYDCFNKFRSSCYVQKSIILQPFVFDASILSKEKDIPPQLIWAKEDRATSDSSEKLDLPIIGIAKLLKGSDHQDDQSIAEIKKKIGEACEKHGFFQVVNHGIDLELVNEAQHLTKHFFGMCLAEKERAKTETGELFGYASSFTGRFTSNLPWKETFTIPTTNTSQYVVDKLGDEFQHYGEVLERVSKAMQSLSLEILEVLGETLGVGNTFRDFYADNDSSIFRANYYPTCTKPDLTLGTGPHCDPTSVTILSQDEVSGLQVCVDGKWLTIKPQSNSLVINVGDTLMAFTNKRYKSCLHRAVVNTEKARTSMVFFLCPRKDKVIRAPEKLIDAEHPRAYPDFTWGLLERFTQLHHRSDDQTSNVFEKWLKDNGMVTV